MTVGKAKELYIERFGGFPEFLFMSASDKDIIDAVKKAIDSGEEIDAPFDDADY